MKGHSCRKAGAIKVESYMHFKSGVPSSWHESNTGQQWKKTQISKDMWKSPGGGYMKENQA